VDPSPAPWRVLEDPVTPGAPSTDAPLRDRTGVWGAPRTTVFAVGGAVLLGLAAFALAFGSASSGTVAVVGGAPVDSQRPTATSGAAATGARGGDVVVVEIVGAVNHPGVFRMGPDARVADLLTAAGGYGPRVDAGRAGRELNLAAPLHDGDQIRVPARDDASAGTSAAGTAPASGAGTTSGRIDLNHATAEQLDTLPGIGPATAAKIIGSRDGQAFAAVDDLRTRKLVGQKIFDGLKDLVTVR